MTADTTLDLLDNDPVFHLKGGMLTMTLVELIRLAPEQFARQLAEKVEQAPNFFVDTPVVIALDKLSEPLSDMTLRHLLSICRDHGLQPIRWIQSRTVPATGNMAPVRIRPGAVVGLEKDLIVSPQHRMLLNGWRSEMLFGTSEAFAAAKHLVNGTTIREARQ